MKRELIACFQDTLQISEERLKENTTSSIKSNKVYKEKVVSTSAHKEENAIISVYSGTSFDVAKKYREHGKVAVLNFANPQNPGGGVCNGAMAQEECLCRSSNLYACINNENVFEEYYGYHREIKNFFFSDRLIYTKDVTVFKNDDEVPRLMPENEWFNVDVITCAAPFLGKRKYTNQKALKELFKGRIRNIFEASIDNEVDVLILGAFGCGAFKNPPEVVAEAFYEVIIENSYEKCFKQIVFAIKSTNNDNPFEPCPNILAFETAFCWNAMDTRLDVHIMTSEFGKLRWTDNYPLAQAVGSIELASGRVLKGGNEFNPYLEWRKKNKYYGKQFSFLGDSITTLNGYNPRGYKVFYYGDNCKKSNVEEYTDTWWGEVLKFFGADLLVNNSWSGSRVTKLPNQEKLFPSGCSGVRTSSLHINSVNPDVIIINLGTNDWAFGARTGEGTRILDDVETELFEEAYRIMLRKIKANYPESEVWCCTLSETFISNKPEFSFPHQYAGIHIEDYNEIIRRTASENQCKLVDLYNMKMPYDSIDGSHPNKSGMKTIAASVCYAMADEAGRNFLALDKEENQYDEEYVFTDPNITTILCDDTICLTDESTEKEIRIKDTFYKTKSKNEDVLNLKEQVKTTEEDCLVGKLISDKYQLKEIIGTGGLTKVYIATDSTNKKFAVKSIKKNAVVHKAVMDVILSEVELLKRLEHPHIRKAVEKIENETHIFIVLEYVEGINLEALASKAGGILPVEKVIRYAVQIAEALQYIHSLNPPIINRDIKPRNIMIDADDNVKLVDFDIAMEYKPHMEDICVLGTKGYAPPEQYAGITTPKSDIYALGMVMHQLLTGVNPVEPPYETNPIRQYNPMLPKGLEYIITKCTEVNPDKRYKNCDELMRDLNDYMNLPKPKGFFGKLFGKK